ncbi:MAG: chitobiase/beta-hexosaminidase C-terminal domain-containing protein [Myxococcales bacterium]|nr:chitobiase/beta-hexosaminidase C-terminal domain-containing protein [Myxococcales bacterium]
MLVAAGAHYENADPADLNDAWSLSALELGDQWRSLAPSGAAPSKRHEPAAAYSPALSRLIIYGGFAGAFYTTPSDMSDLWALNLAPEGNSWTKLTATGGPPTARYGAGLVYDDSLGRFLLFGGAKLASSSTYNTYPDVWQLTVSGSTGTWTKLAPVGTGPAKRYRHATVWDPVGRRMIVIAGYGYLNSAWQALSDVWILSANTTQGAWTAVAPTGTGPGTIADHGAVWDATNQRVLVFGGVRSSGRSNQTWALTFDGQSAQWSQVATTGQPPSPRQAAAVAYDDVHQRLLAFSGYGDFYSDDNTYSLTFSPEGAVWNTITPYVCETTPLASNLLGPADGSTPLGCPITLDWSSASGVRYDVELNGSLVATDLSDSTWTVPAATPLLPTSNTWRVITKGCGTTSAASPTRTFDRAPPSATVIAPADGGSAVACAVSLSWSVPAGVAGGTFDVTLNGATLVTGITGTSLIVPPALALSPTGNTWSVSTRNCAGDVTESPTFTFDRAPRAPIVVAPTDGSELTACGPTLAWQVPGGSGYAYDLLVNGQVVATGLGSASYTLPADLPLSREGNTWEVVARGCDADFAESTPFGFSLADTARPAPPTLTTPPDGGSLPACDRQVTWTGDDGLTFDVALGGQPLAAGLTAKTHTLPLDVTSGESGTVSVVARNCLASDPASATFTLDPPLPTLLEPASGEIVDCVPMFVTSAAAPADVTSTVIVTKEGTTAPLMTLPLSSTSIVVPGDQGLLPGDYAWAVSVTKGGCTRTSSAIPFTVRYATPAAFSITSPAESDVVDDPATVSWTSAVAPGACLASYEVEAGMNTYTVPIGTTQVSLAPQGQVDKALVEDFESPAWSGAAWGGWCYPTSAAHGGTRALSCSGGGGPANTVSFPIDLTGATDARLTLWEYGDIGYDNNCWGVTYAYVLDESGTQNLGLLYEFYGVTTQDSWVRREVDLSPHKGKTVRLLFRRSQSYGCTITWLIDDLEVTKTRPVDPLTCGTNSISVTAVALDGTRFPAASTITVNYPPAPPAPTLLAPAPEATHSCDTTPLAFSWTTNKGDTYDLKVNGATALGGLSSGAATLPAGAPLESTTSWSVTARNCLGETATSESRSITVSSTTPPKKPTLLEPANGATVHCDPTFKWSVEGGTTGLVTDVLVDGQAFVTGLTSQTFTPPGNAGLSEGTHVWQVRTRNCAGQTDVSMPRAVAVANAPSQPVITAPANLAYTSGTPTLSWSGDGGSVAYDVLIDGAAVLTNVSGSTTTLLTPLSHGTHTVELVARGCGGTETRSASRVFLADVTAPAPPSLTKPAPGSWTNLDVVTLEWTPSVDPDSGIAQYTVTVGSEVLSATTTTSAQWSTRIQTLYSKSYGFESSAELADWQFTGSWGRTTSYRRSGSYSLADSTGGNYSNNVDYSATLNAWHIPTADSVISWYDIYEMPAWYQEINGYDDIGLEIRRKDGNWEELASFMGLASGLSNAWFRAESVSLGGYANDEVQMRFYLRTNPTVVANGIFIDDLSITNLANRTKFVPDGTIEVRVAVSDKVGNVSSSTVATIGIDRVPPSTPALVAPAGFVDVGPTGVALTWGPSIDDRAGLARYELLIDGALHVGDISPSVQTMNLSPFGLSDGTHTWAIRAVDRAGNSATSSARDLRFDVAPPSVAPVPKTPANGAYVATLVPDFCFTPAVDSGSGIAGHELFLDGVSQGTSAAGTNCATAIAAEGPHEWFVRARDKAGNSKDSPTWTFVNDLTPPAPFELREPADGQAVLTLRPLLCWGPASDALSGVAFYTLTIAGQSVDVNSDVVSVIVCARPAVALPPGPSAWSVVAVDRAGNTRTASSGPRTLTASADNKAPVATITSPAPGGVAGGDPARLSGTVSDETNGSGVAGVTVMIVQGPILDAVVESSAAGLTWSVTWDQPFNGARSAIARAVDNDGNKQGLGAPYPFVVDLKPPDSFPLLGPPIGSWASPTPTFSWGSSSDGESGIQGYALSWWPEGHPELSESVDAGMATVFTIAQPLVDGAFEWTVTASDRLGHTTTATSSGLVHVDGTPPAAPEPNSPADGAWSADATPELRWHPGSDAGGAICGYRITIDGVVVAPLVTGYNFTTGPLGEGAHLWTVGTVDCVGNVSPPSAPRTLRLDLTPPPVVTLLTPGVYATLSDATPTFSWMPIHDALSGTCGYRVIANSHVWSVEAPTTEFTPTEALADGPVTWNVLAIDCAGNTSQGETPRPLTIDTAAPVLFADPPAGTFAGAFPVALGSNEPAATIRYATAGANVLNSSIQYVSPVLLDGEGTVTLQAIAHDEAGNASEVLSATYVIDREPPALAFHPAGSVYAGPVQITVTTSEAAKVFYTADGSDPVTTGSGISSPATIDLGEEGTTLLKVVAVDSVGNTSAVAEQMYVVDTVPPMTFVLPLGAAYDSPQELTITSAESPATVVYSLDGSDPNVVAPSPVSIPLSADGKYQVRAYSIDLAGNTGPIAAAVLVIDTRAPSIAATPDGGLYDGPVWVELTSDESDAVIHVTLDGSTPTAESPIYNGKVLVGATDGLFEVRAIAVDVARNESPELVVAYEVDTNAPSTHGDPPGGWFRGPVDVMLSTDEGAELAWDASGGSPDPSAAVAGPVTIHLDTEGTHVVRALSVDVVGNVGALFEATYRLDWTPPAVAVTPDGGSFPAPPNVTLTASEPATIHVQLDGAPATVSSPVASGPVLVSAEGMTVLRAMAVDEAGNEGPASEASFTVDTLPPSGLAVVSPAPDTWVSSSTPPFCWEAATDATSGLESYALIVDGKPVWTGLATCAVAAAPLPDGPHTWEVAAADAFDHTAVTDPVSFGVDGTPPTSALFAWSAVEPGVYELEGTAGDSHSGVTSVVVFVDGGSPVGAVDDEGTFATWTATTSLPPGSHLVRTEAVDLAGNTEPEGAAIEIVVPEPATACSLATWVEVGGTASGTTEDGTGKLAPAACGAAPGHEFVYRLAADPQARYRVELIPSPGADLLLYAIEDCDPGAPCVAAAPVEGGGGQVLELADAATPGTSAPSGTWYLVVDTIGSSGGFELTVSLVTQEPDPDTGGPPENTAEESGDPDVAGGDEQSPPDTASGAPDEPNEELPIIGDTSASGDAEPVHPRSDLAGASSGDAGCASAASAPASGLGVIVALAVLLLGCRLGGRRRAAPGRWRP